MVDRLEKAKENLKDNYEKYMHDISKRVSIPEVTSLEPPPIDTMQSTQSSLDSLPRASTSGVTIPIQDVQPQDIFDLFTSKSGFKILVIDVRDIPDFIDGHISWARPGEEFMDFPAGAVIPIDSIYLRPERYVHSE